MQAPHTFTETHSEPMTLHADALGAPEALRAEPLRAEPLRAELRPAESVTAPRRRRRRWDPEEKHALTLRAYEMRQAGARWSEVASELNVLEGSLRKWLEDFEAASRAEHGEATVRTLRELNPDGGAIAVTTPDGFRVEGLSVEDAHLLIEMLRVEGHVEEEEEEESED